MNVKLKNGKTKLSKLNFKKFKPSDDDYYYSGDEEKKKKRNCQVDSSSFENKINKNVPMNLTNQNDNIPMNENNPMNENISMKSMNSNGIQITMNENNSTNHVNSNENIPMNKNNPMNRINPNELQITMDSMNPNENIPMKEIIKIALETEMKHLTSSVRRLIHGIGLDWFRALEPEFSKAYFLKLADFVCEERNKCTIYPAEKDIFSWTDVVSIRDVKVVILGQDPYHGPGQAHGLCFSVPVGIQIPPSLENIYKELKSTIPGFVHPGHGYLMGWAKQGVLLLNSVLTVKAHCANSHKDRGWEQFTDGVVKWLSENGKGIVFMLWGAYAQKKGAKIDKKRHHVLQGVHPSPLSAHRGFFGCGHFKRCNELLRGGGGDEDDDDTKNKDDNDNYDVVNNKLSPIDWNFLALDEGSSSLKKLFDCGGETKNRI